MPTMSKDEYSKLFGDNAERPDPDEEKKLQEASDWRRRVARRGYLFDEHGHPWPVPRALIDLYREKYPELGRDLPDQWLLGEVALSAGDDR